MARPSPMMTEKMKQPPPPQTPRKRPARQKRIPRTRSSPASARPLPSLPSWPSSFSALPSLEMPIGTFCAAPELWMSALFLWRGPSCAYPSPHSGLFAALCFALASLHPGLGFSSCSDFAVGCGCASAPGGRAPNRRARVGHARGLDLRRRLAPDRGRGRGRGRLGAPRHGGPRGGRGRRGARRRRPGDPGRLPGAHRRALTPAGSALAGCARAPRRPRQRPLPPHGGGRARRRRCRCRRPWSGRRRPCGPSRARRRGCARCHGAAAPGRACPATA
mmetsp:Transcript_125173/g.362161  ORF Transcript_125173/g.362161 Transcript_125173/m.362161 type:complete len:276 (-) Transcript_125173:916-1743(-)